MFDFDDLGDPEPGTDRPPPSKLHAVWWLNLARRSDRRTQHESALEAAGLNNLAERVEAVDGVQLDLDTLDQNIVSQKAIAEAKNPPSRVVGVYMTRGAIGLWLSWHAALSRIVEEDAAGGCCYLLAEDDATYSEDFRERLVALFIELDEYDPYWDAVQVGYFADEREVIQIECSNQAGKRKLQHIVQPVWACGTAGVIINGVHGAKCLLRTMFPARASQQLDTALSYRYKKMRFYMSSEPLMVAEKSTEVDTDIQIMKEATRGWNSSIQA